MKTLYLECGMGAAGDMLTAALLELLPNPDSFLAELNALGLPGISVTRSSASKCGIRGTHVSVRINGAEESAHFTLEEEQVHSHTSLSGSDHHHNHENSPEQESFHGHNDLHHSHASLQGIEHIVSSLPLSDTVRQNILSVYGLIAEAESHVHGVPVNEIHFHEVGTMDAVADVTAVCLLMERLAPEQVIVSPIHVGSGTVRCAHGILPVPAPATAEILRGIPIYGGSVRGELCTPTGAALLRYFADAFGEMPVMKVSAIGCGMGTKDFSTANCIRAFLGETENDSDTVVQFSCNLDDMTAEELAFASEMLYDAGALEVFSLPAGMKKSRPGFLLCVLCPIDRKEEVACRLFRHTTTLGIRETLVRRRTLARRTKTKKTPFGPMRIKHSAGFGVTREKYEYEDLARVAREQGISLREVIAAISEEETT